MADYAIYIITSLLLLRHMDKNTIYFQCITFLTSNRHFQYRRHRRVRSIIYVNMV